MHSQSSPHAMIWYHVCPFEARLQIASHLVKMRVRQELDLCMPCLTDAYNHRRLVAAPIRPKLKFAVHAVCKAAGLTTFIESIGEIPGIENPNGNEGKVEEALLETKNEVKALRNSVNEVVTLLNIPRAPPMKWGESM